MRLENRFLIKSYNVASVKLYHSEWAPKRSNRNCSHSALLVVKISEFHKIEVNQLISIHSQEDIVIDVSLYCEFEPLACSAFDSMRAILCLNLELTPIAEVVHYLLLLVRHTNYNSHDSCSFKPFNDPLEKRFTGNHYHCFGYLVRQRA